MVFFSRLGFQHDGDSSSCSSSRNKNKKKSSDLMSMSMNMLCMLLLLLLLLPCGCWARITVPGTHERFASHEDRKYGQRLWKNELYKMRMQVIHMNLHLCPVEGNEYHLTVPKDGSPVALLVQYGGCSLQEKLDNLVENVYPKGLVRAVIIDNGMMMEDPFHHHQHHHHDTEQQTIVALPQADSEQEDNRFVEIAQPSQATNLDLSDEPADEMDGDNAGPRDAVGDGFNFLADLWSAFHFYPYDNNDVEDYPLHVIHVSYTSLLDLLDIIRQEDGLVRTYGGTRITIDSRLGTGDGFLGGAAALWMALSALVSACACALLLILNGTERGWFEPDEPTPQPPRRPTRRRLTKEQVRAMLPVYQFDGNQLVMLEQPQPQENQGLLVARREDDPDASAETPLLAHLPPPPETLDLSLCSICLDEYECGDRMRCLPCNHIFHAKCVGKWLSERSATCPLCKTDLYNEDEEEDDEEEEPREVREVVTQTEAPPPEGEQQQREGAEPVSSTPWWSGLFQAFDRERVLDTATTTTETEPFQPPPTETTTTTTIGTSTEAEDRVYPTRSWWRSMFPRLPTSPRRPSTTTLEGGATVGGGSVEATTLNMLTEPLLVTEQAAQQQDEEAPVVTTTTPPDPPAPHMTNTTDATAQTAATEEETVV